MSKTTFQQNVEGALKKAHAKARTMSAEEIRAYYQSRGVINAQGQLTKEYGGGVAKNGAATTSREQNGKRAGAGKVVKKK
jgi:hypothetical protein